MTSTKKTKFAQLLDQTPDETRRLVQKQDEIAVRICALLKQKGWNQIEFAQKIGMKESRLSKILAGNANLTLKTIARIEAVLGKDIIWVPLVDEQENTLNSMVQYAKDYEQETSATIHTLYHQKTPLPLKE